MRISDWSSDVCSSDLPRRGADHHRHLLRRLVGRPPGRHVADQRRAGAPPGCRPAARPGGFRPAPHPPGGRRPADRHRAPAAVAGCAGPVGAGARALARRPGPPPRPRPRPPLPPPAPSYVDWSGDLPAGTSQINGVPVHRLAVDPLRDPEVFGRLHTRLEAADPPIDTELQQQWLDAQGPSVPELEAWLDEQAPRFDVVAFFTYLYATTTVGLPVAARHTATALVP